MSKQKRSRKIMIYIVLSIFLIVIFSFIILEYQKYKKEKEVTKYNDYYKEKETVQYNNHEKDKETVQYDDHTKEKETVQYNNHKKETVKEQFHYKEKSRIVHSPYSGAYMQSGTNHQALEILREQINQHSEISQILFAYNLDDEWEMEQIPENKLQDLENALSLAEELGKSVIFRAAYDFKGEPRDPEFPIIISHIKQISEVLNRHKDCISGVQAGMLGVYGEWHSSEYMDDVHYRLEVIRNWLAYLDESIFISVRRPKFIRDAEENGIDTARIGFYNDGLFGSDSDLGTYVGDYNREADLQWANSNIKIPFNGGEMPYVTEFASIENVVKEAKLLNLSYLNYWYNTDVWDYWKTEEYEEMSGDQYLLKHLGYRFYVKEMKIQENFETGDELELEIALKNNGFAMIDPNMKAYAILEYNGEKIETEMNLQMSSKEDGKIYGKIENPFSEQFLNTNKNGLEIGIKIARNKDVSEAYCIEFANEDILFRDGYNWLLN